MDRQLYGWQEECLERWFANGGRGIVQAVTGAGKTLLALTAVERMEKKLNRELRIKIVVPTSALMRQWNRDIREFLSDSGRNKTTALEPRKEIGMRGGGFQSSGDCKYMIYVINSARYELARQILAQLKQGEAVLLIADECHHYGSGQNQLIFEFLPYIQQYQSCFFSMGLSAALPVGEARQYLTSVLGRKIYQYGIEDAAAHHTICPYDIYHISLSFRAGEKEMYEELTEQMNFLFCRLLRSYPFLGMLGLKERYEFLRTLSGDKNRIVAKAASGYRNLSYKRKSLVCLASARIACACDLIESLDVGEKILVFSERISQADQLYQLLQEQYQERVGRFHSKMGVQANKNALERFRTGSIRILIACKAIDEGINIPDASVGIILSGSSAQRQRVQRLGRIIRKKEAKDRAALYYLHIEESCEDSCFLPEGEGHRLFELAYDAEKKQFSNPAYDKKAARLLGEMQTANVGKEKLREAERCLRLGCVRADWLLDRTDIEKRIKAAVHTGDKNYWICMKKLGEV